MGSESAGTNWNEEFAKCTRRLEDAATLKDAIDSHQAVLDLLFGRMLYIYMQGWPESVKSSAIATLKEDIESYLEATPRLLAIVQRKEQLIWEFKSCWSAALGSPPVSRKAVEICAPWFSYALVQELPDRYVSMNVRVFRRTNAMERDDPIKVCRS